MTETNAKKSAVFALRLAWKINKKVFLAWVFASVALSVLPAIVLVLNREVISTISGFLASGEGAFSDVVGSILLLGLFVAVNGLSGRVNHDLVYMMMYDTYYYGMGEQFMNKRQKVSREYLLDKAVRDEMQSTSMKYSTLNSFMTGLVTVIGKGVSVLSLLAVAASVSWVIFAICLAYILAASVYNFRASNKLQQKYEDYDRALHRARYYQKMARGEGLAKEVRIYESRDDILKQWNEAYTIVEKMDKQRDRKLQMQPFFSGLLFYVAMAGILLYAIFSVARGEMTADVFLMVYSLSTSFSGAIGEMTKGLGTISWALFELGRQRKLLFSAPERRDSENPREIDTSGDTVYEFKHVTFGYDPEKPVLKDVSFKIKKGENVALVGYNGSGKTTLTALMLDSYRPQAGEVLLYGHPLSEYRYDDVKKQIGVFFQQCFIFHSPLRDNVGYGCVEEIGNEARIREAIRAGGAEKVVAKLPRGIDTWLRRDIRPDGVGLSGGEQQRICVARTHMSEAPIMIFDEPAAALDPIAEMEQFTEIKKKVAGRTSVLISHRVGFARLADRILVMDGGRLVEDGTHEELLAKNGVYASFFREQAKWYDSGEEVKEDAARTGNGI